MDIFEQYFYDLNIHRRLPPNDTEHADVTTILEEKISIFETDATINTTSAVGGTGPSAYGLINLNPNFYRISELRFNDNGTWRYIERVSKKELTRMNLGPLTKPNAKRPVYFIDTEFNVAEVHGFNTILGVITVEYIRRPLPVNWGYIEVNGAALYEPVSSVNFELHNSEQTDIVFKILALAGISIKNPELYQAGTVEDAKSTQQQKM